MLVFMAAMSSELKHVEPLVREPRSLKLGGMPATLGKAGDFPVLLVQTGVGSQRAQAGVAAVLVEYKPEAIVSIGFAGSAAGAVHRGDLVIAEALESISFQHVLDINVAPATTPWNPSPRLAADQGLLRACRQALRDGKQWHSGLMVSLPMIADPKLKRWIGERSGAIAVDMESYWAGEAAAQAKVPCIAVRSIVDGVKDWLPPMEHFGDEMGEINHWQSAFYFIGAPHRIFPAILIGFAAAAASRSLGRFAAGLLASWPRLRAEAIP